MRALKKIASGRPAAARAFARDRSGLAAVEFALILPIMVVIFFGMLEASDLFTVNRRLANAANSLVDLAAHEPTVTNGQIDDMIVGVTKILEPTDTSTVVMRVVSVTKGASVNDPPLVHWSRDQSGAAPYAAGETYTGLDDNLALNPNSSLIVVEIEYTYQSAFSGEVFTVPFEFEHKSKRWPRKSTEVQLCTSHTPPAAPVGCTT
ncbi:MAG: TadE/TadG family type IV pilus assembly protein [Parvularculaceae bacterium]|nr:TadE/TadG family type IV pilus assembly protein [Parvularculaceae bacterium]